MNNMPHVPTRITTKDKDYQNIVNILNDVREHTYKEYAVPYKEVAERMYELIKSVKDCLEANDSKRGDLNMARTASLFICNKALTEYDNKIGGKK